MKPLMGQTTCALVAQCCTDCFTLKVYVNLAGGGLQSQCCTTATYYRPFAAKTSLRHGVFYHPTPEPRKNRGSSHLHDQLFSGAFGGQFHRLALLFFQTPESSEIISLDPPFLNTWTSMYNDHLRVLEEPFHQDTDLLFHRLPLQERLSQFQSHLPPIPRQSSASPGISPGPGRPGISRRGTARRSRPGSTC